MLHELSVFRCMVSCYTISMLPELSFFRCRDFYCTISKLSLSCYRVSYYTISMLELSFLRCRVLYLTIFLELSVFRCRVLYFTIFLELSVFRCRVSASRPESEFTNLPLRKIPVCAGPLKYKGMPITEVRFIFKNFTTK